MFGKIFLVVVDVSMFATALAILAMTSRVVFSMARAGILPGSSFLARVHKGSGAPVFAIGFVTVVAIAVTLIAQKLSTVTSVASIYYALVYLILTLVYLARRNKLPSPEVPFSLGRSGCSDHGGS